MRRSDSKARQWDRVAGGWFGRGHGCDLIDEHGRKTHLALLSRWGDLTKGRRILKTDLFDVAFKPHPFLFDLARVNDNIIGIDVSNKVVNAAKNQARYEGVDAGRYLCCDVRRIPLQDNSVDLVISDSTLDHFPSEADLVDALTEIRRVLRCCGTLVLALDNKSNLTYPPYPLVRLWMRLGLAPYFIGRTFSPKILWSILEDIGFTVEESTAIFHCPHPDALVRWLERVLRRISGGRLDNTIRKSLAVLDKLGEKRTKYLTGRYIVLKAVKRDMG